MRCLEDFLYNLVVDASTNLPEDVESALICGLNREEDGSAAQAALKAIVENIDLARERRQPLCQDTGTLIFHVWIPQDVTFSQAKLRETLESAVVRATEEGVLRQNSVCPLTGKNSGNNLGPGAPFIHYHQGEKGSDVKVTLMLKGGGSENVGVQYSLPDKSIDAGRDIDGVKKCIIDAVLKAQGKGCSPGILSVVVGGDRATGYEQSKEQLLREVGSENPDADLNALEKEMLEKTNSLEIGPMGLGGRTTVLDVFIGKRNRVPASYFVTISYMCWAFRRRSVSFPAKLLK